jgi:glycosyltransferase involved in cell wall biosynthesis
MHFSKLFLQNKIYYFGMVNTVEYSSMVEDNLYIGAGSNKIISIIRALRSVNVKAYLVSSPVLNINSNRKYIKSAILKSKVGPQYFIATSPNRVLRKLLSLIFFAIFCIRNVKKGDKVIFYNHCTEYIFGLIILFMRGNKGILDIEDAPGSDEKGIYGISSIIRFKIFRLLTKQESLIVGDSLAKEIGLKKYCVLHGSVDNKYAINNILTKIQNKTTFPIIIHYGGSLISELGVDIFCDGVKLLLGEPKANNGHLKFIITGFGSEWKIYDLIDACKNSKIKIEYQPNADPKTYQKILQKCDASLSLRIPNNSMTNRTFPSKVIEITGNGLLLITTKINDLTAIFDKESAFYLNEANSIDFKNVILEVIESIQKVDRIRLSGYRVCINNYSDNVVGNKVANFIYRNNI